MEINDSLKTTTDLGFDPATSNLHTTSVSLRLHEDFVYQHAFAMS